MFLRGTPSAIGLLLGVTVKNLERVSYFASYIITEVDTEKRDQLMHDKEADRKPWADATRVILPTFAGGGTHVNLSGVVLARHAPNKDNAIKLMEWLVGEKAQHIYADMNYEYPLLSEVKINPTIASYGTLKPDALPLAEVAKHKKAAANLVDKVGFDN